MLPHYSSLPKAKLIVIIVGFCHTFPLFGNLAYASFHEKLHNGVVQLRTQLQQELDKFEQDLKQKPRQRKATNLALVSKDYSLLKTLNNNIVGKLNDRIETALAQIEKTTKAYGPILDKLKAIEGKNHPKELVGSLGTLLSVCRLETQLAGEIQAFLPLVPNRLERSPNSTVPVFGAFWELIDSRSVRIMPNLISMVEKAESKSTKEESAMTNELSSLNPELREEIESTFKEFPTTDFLAPYLELNANLLIDLAEHLLQVESLDKKGKAIPKYLKPTLNSLNSLEESINQLRQKETLREERRKEAERKEQLRQEKEEAREREAAQRKLLPDPGQNCALYQTLVTSSVPVPAIPAVAFKEVTKGATDEMTGVVSDEGTTNSITPEGEYRNFFRDFLGKNFGPEIFETKEDSLSKAKEADQKKERGIDYGSRKNTSEEEDQSNDQQAPPAPPTLMGESPSKFSKSRDGKATRKFYENLVSSKSGWSPQEDKARLILDSLFQSQQKIKVEELDDLFPGLKPEILKDDRAGFTALRLNGQWRIVFKNTDQGAKEVEITDYH